MKRLGIFSLLVIAGCVMIGLAGCDYVDEPYTEGDPGTGPDTTTTTIRKKVLLEDFTGHACGNCPRAHEKGESLSNLYGDDLVIVALHSGFFADASGAIHGSNYTTDYNSDISNAVDEYYDADNAGFPKGLIDRREYNGNALVNHPDWGGHVATRLDDDPIMGLEIASTYNAGSGSVDIEVDVNYQLAGTADDYLVVIITEDSVESYQKDYSLNPQDIPDYQHRHVARAAVSPIWGTRLSTAAIAAGDSFTETYTFSLDGGWDADHCYVVAYVIDGNTREVWNVEETKLKGQ